MKFHQFNDLAVPTAGEIVGTSETIPGLAPDLRSIVMSACAGEPLPLTSKPLYDEDEEAGAFRVNLSRMSPEQAFEMASELEKKRDTTASSEVDNAEAVDPIQDEQTTSGQ